MYYIFDDCGNCLFYTETKPDNIFIYDCSVMFIPKETPTIYECDWY